MNKVIVIALGVLVLLIAFSFFLSSFMQNRSQTGADVPTPIPTTTTSGSGRSNYPDVYDEVHPDKHFDYTSEETAKINLLKDRMPYTGPDFDMDYSEELNQFYVQKKGANADAAFNDFLAQNGLTDIARNRGALFTQTTETPQAAIRKVEDQITAQRRRAEVMDELSDEAPAAKSDEEEDFVDTGLTLFSFNFGGPKPDAPAGKGTGTCSTGGYPFPTRDQGLIGRPYQGTHTLGNWQSDNAVDLGTPIGTTICAVEDGTIHRVKLQNPNPSSRFAGWTLYLQTANNEWWYAHLSSVAPGIAEGTQVKAGQTIGYSGAANNVPHLHFAVRNGNPVSLLGL